ncbi:MAG: hypothetical protein IKW89_04630 [Bacteroidales bacterium]|nr:hypothetical protein [Bacteroidales bacterium]
MKDKATKLIEYIQPDAEEIRFAPEGMLCESTLPGGNEGIGFENWN